MKLYIKNNLFSITGSSLVTNDKKETIYEIRGSFFSPTHKKEIYDKDGKLLYIVRNKYWRFFNRYALIYDANKNLIARVCHGYFAIKKFTVDNCKDNFEINGQLFSFDSTIYKNGQPLATLTRAIDFFRDSFELEAPEEDMPFLIALVVAVDNITDQKSRDIHTN